VLRQVGMTGQKNQVVSSPSGGQRKRVSIAVELLAEPPLFFLDEPTSGLDPGLEKKMMHTLRHLADGGRTVVLVTHATANITQCDHVCFLSQGRMVYFGPPQEALQFFGVTSGDFADIYAQLDDPDPGRARQKAAQWEQRFKQSPQYGRYVTDRQRALPQVKRKAAHVAARQRPRVNPVRQFFVLTRRYLDLVLRDKLLLTVLLAVMPIIGILLLLISKPNWLVGDTLAEIEHQLAADLAAGEQSATYAIVGKSQTLLFMLALAAVLLGLFAAAYEIVKERSIYLRERMVTVRLFPYLASKVTVLGTFALLQCLLLLFVLSWKVRLPKEGVFLPAPLEMYVTLIVGTLAATMMGLLISALVPNTDTVIYVVLLVLFFQIIFAGVIFDLPGVAKNFSALTLTRWAMEGLGTSVDVERLNGLTRTRFQPDPITKEVSLDVPKPDPEWEPVTVVTETREIVVPCPSGINVTVPITVPEVMTHEMVTVTETVTETKTFTPTVQTIAGERELQIDYTHTAGHLCWNWLLLIGFGLVLGLATVIVLKRKDVG
nr:ATP-binding cassette domain-containing protein [Anaerolineae bacterium]